MPPHPKVATENHNNKLRSLPPEVIINIFCQLPSFADVLGLAATCHRLKDIWITNVTTIYASLSPRAIPCEREARVCLSDQGGPSPDSLTLSANDVLRMVRNARMVDESISQFEEDIVPHVRSEFCYTYEIWNYV